MKAFSYGDNKIEG